jgi:hypothetical protein
MYPSVSARASAPPIPPRKPPTAGIMHTDASYHAAHVEDWLSTAATDLSAAGLIDLLERGLAALWHGASETLGEITLTAIVDRILFVASERYPFVAITKAGSTLVAFEVRPLGAVQPERRLREVVAFVLTEFIAVLGNLTDEILTPALHGALAGVRHDGLARGQHDAEEAAR